MATQLQLRSGTTLQNNIFTGAPGELTYDTEKKNIRIHDGATEGGMVVASQGTADFVIAWQMPTEENGYTWYRKYASGWVEQGGQCGNGTQTIVLSVIMANANYVPELNITMSTDTAPQYTPATNSTSITTTGFKATFGSGPNVCSWKVSGMSAQGE